MVAYAAYHQNRWNKVTHFFGVPLAIVSLLIPFAWFRFAPALDLRVSGAHVFYVGVLIYYWRLDRTLAAVIAALAIPLVLAAEWVARLPFLLSVGGFVLVTVLGWAIQLLGHYFEGKRPALTDNLLQIFNAPLFVVLEVFFLLGWRRTLRHEVEAALGA
jgi:uncharacterized membrane protein YGL010W